MSPNDIEQLATFMGRTNDVHKQVYRLPDDISNSNLQTLNVDGKRRSRGL